MTTDINRRADAMSDDKLPPLDKVIAALKIGHKYLGPDTVDVAAAAWLERQQTEIERLKLEHQLAHDDWKRSEAEIERLRKAIQNYLDGNWGTRLPRKIDKCPHDRFGWEDCGNCVDEYFAGVLRTSEG